ncbi:hypothetical protein NBH00_03130 [Paraconexibacter antarcticus]|uniref:Uncharacterized protein n=1 Tax=Paraconexibacter antarcticus TaxID=2949664 RepID=A0ABY5DT57_9ACTN|nr:hypothetical protein [Paraconexibacter antarcticus]UTI65210.1 hypothetical protein NBH00_03130 [Paraconexibacter antarcticus]
MMRGIGTKTTVALAGMAGAGLAASGGLSLAVAATADPPPRLTELKYGKIHQPGTAGRVDQFRLMVNDPNGQVVTITIDSKAGVLKAKRACGAGGRINGGTTTAYIPAVLPKGAQKVTVTLSSTHCNGRKPGRLQRRTFVRYLKVR